MKSYKALAISLIAVLVLCSEAFCVAPVKSGMPDPMSASTQEWLDYSFDGSAIDIPFDLEGAGLGASGANVYIAIYSGIPAGSLVKTWEVGTFSGAGTATWDGTDADGQAVPEGYYTYFIYAVNNNDPATWCGVSSWDSYNTTGSIDFSVDPPAFWTATKHVGTTHGMLHLWGTDGSCGVSKSLIGLDYLSAPGAEAGKPYNFTNLVTGVFGSEWLDDENRPQFRDVEYDPNDPNRIFAANREALAGVWAFRVVSEDLTLIQEGGPGIRAEWEIDTSWNDDGHALDNNRPKQIEIYDGIIYALVGDGSHTKGVVKLSYANGDSLGFIDLSEYVPSGHPNGLYVGPHGIYVVDTVEVGEWPWAENVEAVLIHADLNGNVIWAQSIPPETAILTDEGQPHPAGIDNQGVWVDRFGNVYVTSYAAQRLVTVLGPDGSMLWYLGYDQALNNLEVPEGMTVEVAEFPPGDSRSVYNGLYLQSRNLLGHHPYSVAMGMMKGPDMPTGVEEVEAVVPKAFGLSQNYPNPFNPSTFIEFNLTSSDFATLVIYNSVGQVVRTLVSEELEGSKAYRVEWDGRDDYGVEQASGIYIYELRAGGYREAKKMILEK
jgi:flagellar hook assembly protein FlgD